MAQDEEPSGVAAIAADVALDPGNGLGHVLDVDRMLDRGRQAIVYRDEDVALAGELLGLGPYFGALVSLDVTPAVKEDDDRMISAKPRRVDVECCKRVGAGGIVGDVPGDPVAPLGGESDREKREPQAIGFAHDGSL